MSDTPRKAPPKSLAARRRMSRLLAVQALYQIAMTGQSSQVVIGEFYALRMGNPPDGLDLEELGITETDVAECDRDYFAELVGGVARDKDSLDNMLAAVLDEEWSLERLERLMMCVLRAATFEISERPDVPARVVITEYVDIAHAFFSGKEPAMVNGMLDNIARSLRLEEFETDGSR